MAQLRQDASQFEELDAAIVVVGPEDRAAFADYFEHNQLPFIGLPDPGHAVLKLFGQEVNLFKLGRMPAMVIVDKAGLVRFAHYGHSMSDIPENKDVLAALSGLEPTP